MAGYEIGPIRNLHPSQKGRSSHFRLGEKVVDQLTEAVEARVKYAGKLYRLMNSHLWWVQEQGKDYVITVRHGSAAVEPGWRLTVRGSKITRIVQMGPNDEDELASEPAEVTGSF